MYKTTKFKAFMFNIFDFDLSGFEEGWYKNTTTDNVRYFSALLDVTEDRLVLKSDYLVERTCWDGISFKTQPFIEICFSRTRRDFIKPEHWEKILDKEEIMLLNKKANIIERNLARSRKLEEKERKKEEEKKQALYWDFLHHKGLTYPPKEEDTKRGGAGA